jgi:glycosyltransferase involved in cell wall biosynthesis
VSVVVPCFQEEDALAAFGPVLARIQADEVLFVDDGSRDETPARLAQLAAADPRVRVLTHAENRGVGAATRTGLAAATRAIAAVYDADATYSVDDLEALVAGVRAGADVVGASPLAAPGGLGDVPWTRRLLTRAAALAYRLVLGRRARHLTVHTCAFRAYRGAVLPRVLPVADGFPAAAEMLGRAVLEGLRVEERPAVLSRRRHGASKLRLLRALPGHLLGLVRLLGLRLGLGRRG